MMERIVIISVCVISAVFTLQINADDKLPNYYPPDYNKIIEQSKRESHLQIYSNVAEYNWKYILEGFNTLYPWIKVETVDLGPAKVFERYYSESAVGKRTADLIVSGAPDAWMRFVDRQDVLPYDSPEIAYLPDWSVPYKGLYTISSDPVVIIYNKLLLSKSQYPRSLKSLERIVSYDGWGNSAKLTSYNAKSHSFGYGVHWTLAKHHGDTGWPLLQHLGANTQTEESGATMVEKVTAGEYLAGYLVSGITVFPRMSQRGRQKILGWSLIEDGTPVFIRGMGITKNAININAAKLMLDFVLSKAGQTAVGKGGMTPYRHDIDKEEVPYLTYDKIEKEVGKENVIRVDYDRDSIEKRKEFLAKWSRAFTAIK